MQYLRYNSVVSQSNEDSTMIGTNDQAYLNRAYSIYNNHLQLFIHSNDFVQQRTTQFSTLNTILFAIYGVLLAITFDSNSTFRTDVLSTIISFLGIFSAFVWYCSYKRSDLYRQIHRDTLHQIDKKITEIQLNDSHRSVPELLGPFQLRHYVMYEGNSLRFGSDEIVRVNYFSKKKKMFNVESIPIFAMIVWAAFFILQITILIPYIQAPFQSFISSLQAAIATFTE